MTAAWRDPMPLPPILCRDCRRLLVDPVSRARQRGPGCWRKHRPAGKQMPIPTPPSLPRRLRGRLVEDVPLPEIDDDLIENDES